MPPAITRMMLASTKLPCSSVIYRVPSSHTPPIFTQKKLCIVMIRGRKWHGPPSTPLLYLVTIVTCGFFLAKSAAVTLYTCVNCPDGRDTTCMRGTNRKLSRHGSAWGIFFGKTVRKQKQTQEREQILSKYDGHRHHRHHERTISFTYTCAPAWCYRGYLHSLCFSQTPIPSPQHPSLRLTWLAKPQNSTDTTTEPQSSAAV